jgi:hypothetical protein
MPISDDAIGQDVLHELDLVISGPADFDDDPVEMGAGRAGQGQLRCGPVQQLGKVELRKIGALGGAAAGAAGRARYPLTDIQVEIDDFDPAGMFAVRAFAFNIIEFDKCVKTHRPAPSMALKITLVRDTTRRLHHKQLKIPGS